MSRVLTLALFVVSCAESSRSSTLEADVWIDEEGGHARRLPREECTFIERIRVERLDALEATVSPELPFYIASNVEPGATLRVAVQVLEPIPAGELDVRVFVNGAPAAPSSAAVACVIGSSP